MTNKKATLSGLFIVICFNATKHQSFSFWVWQTAFCKNKLICYNSAQNSQKGQSVPSNIVEPLERERELDSEGIREYLKGPIFYERYIKHNTRSFIENNLFFIIKDMSKGSAIRFLARVLKKTLNVFGRKTIVERYFKKELLKGRIYIPSISLSVTTKCTLNCKSCNNLMPYFTADAQYSSTLNNMCKHIDKLLEKVECIQHLNVIGGEPLLFKDLPKLIDFLGSRSKIKRFSITTNGTIRFNDALLQALSKYKNAYVAISDYSASPNIKVRLYMNEIIQSLKDAGISFVANFTQKGEYWIDPGKYYKRNRSKEDNTKNLLSCHQMYCTMILDDKLFVCPVAKSLSILKGTDEFEGEFLWINDNLTRKNILDFYKNDFFEACDYCQDLWIEQKRIEPAVQIKGALKMEP